MSGDAQSIAVGGAMSSRGYVRTLLRAAESPGLPIDLLGILPAAFATLALGLAAVAVPERR